MTSTTLPQSEYFIYHELAEGVRSRHHKTIWIWASNSGIVDLGDRKLIFDTTFSPDGKYILTASEDNTARLWQIDLDATLREVCALLTRDLTSEERIQFNISNEGPTCPAQ